MIKLICTIHYLWREDKSKFVYPVLGTIIVASSVVGLALVITNW